MSFFRLDISQADIARFEADLEKLTARMRLKIVKKGISAATNEVKKAMKKLVPVKTGDLKRSIIHRVRQTKSGVWEGRVGAYGKESPLVHLIEGGTKAHKIFQPKFNRTIHHPGSKKYPFLEKAAISAKHAATQKFIERLKKELE